MFFDSEEYRQYLLQQAEEKKQRDASSRSHHSPQTPSMVNPSTSSSAISRGVVTQNEAEEARKIMLRQIRDDNLKVLYSFR